METWFLIISTLCISAILKAFFNLLFPVAKAKANLPPGPPKLPIIGNFLWLYKYKSFLDLGPILRNLHPKYGPILTLHVASYLTIYVSDRSLAHQALIQNASVFADRTPPVPNFSNRFNIGSAAYGSTWRTLRRNLTAEILNPSRINSYSQARSRVFRNLKKQLIKSLNTGDRIHVIDHFRNAMICLLGLICFGAELDENQIRKLEVVQRDFLSNIHKFDILNFFPKVTKVLFHRRWKEFKQILNDRDDVYVQLIKERRKTKEKDDHHYISSYVDTLLELKHPEEKRELDEKEIVSLCTEFFTAGMDPTTTALEWIMANLVKYPHIQEKLYMEIKGVMGDAADHEEVIKEDYLQKMPYLKAVVLESLRRHPPGYFLFHGVTRDVIFNDFLVPRKAGVVFFIQEMGLDTEIWENPMEFNPERFVNVEEEVDLTGRKEIKMIPFGAGRRICPGLSFVMLHLQYFVANLVWFCMWKSKDGEDVDLSVKKELTVMMKNPLRACLHSWPV